MTEILFNDSIRIRVTFRTWSEDDTQGAVVDPISVIGKIINSNFVAVATFTNDIVHESEGVFSYIWTPTTLGDFYVEFDGLMNDDASPIVDSVREAFTVVASNVNLATQVLAQDQFITFMPDLEPIYIDPEEILVIYPDASPIDVNELLYFYSHEVDELMGAQAKTTLAYEYLRAAVLCSLSKVFGSIDNSDIAQITLGDFSIETRNLPSTTLNRGNADTWCELAAALRAEILVKFYRVGFKAIEKGTNFINPIQSRNIDETPVI